ncbi:MAG: rod shape-determining protein MreC [Flavobacteriaceae bacterium]
MQWVLNVIIRYKNFLLFFFLLNISLLFSAKKSEYHNSQLAKSILFFSGIIHEPFDNLSSYFELKEENQRLQLENNTLKNLVLDKFNQSEILALENENLAGPNYWSLPARLIRNSYTQNRNMLLLNKGENDGVTKEMGVIGTKGIVGIVNQTSQGYATVLSILNLDLKINAKFQNSNVFGSLYWTAEAPNKMKLADVSVINSVAVGDTLVTGGMSSYFPEGIVIGTVIEVVRPNNGGYYDIEIELINNMTDIKYVYVIGNNRRKEIIELLEQTP